MTDAILVLNAGSSSIKFSLFSQGGPELAPVAGGQVEGIYTAPRFVAKDAAGKPAGEKRWETGVKLGHDGALAHVLDWLKAAHGGEYRLTSVGHRVVHGGTEFAAPVRLDATLLAKLEKLVPLAPLHQPHNLAPIRALFERAPEIAQVACFDTAAHRSNPLHAQMFALPSELTEAGCGATGSTGSPTSTSRPCCRGSTTAPLAAVPWSFISGTGPACARSKPAGASRAPWASPRWTACPWGRAAGRSTPASSCT